MQYRFIAAVAVVSVMLPLSVAAQDFGVMNSAETINKGNFKVMANPIVIFGKGNADNQIGVALAGGYGFTDRVDVEGRAGLFDGVKFFGADLEAWLVKGRKVDVSAIGGFHLGREDGFNSKALDFALLGSGHVAPKLELYGGLDVARYFINDSDIKFTTVHLVPGIEYAIGPDIDFNAELGLALNNDAQHYVSAGIAFYFR